MDNIKFLVVFIVLLHISISTNCVPVTDSSIPSVVVVPLESSTSQSNVQELKNYQVKMNVKHKGNHLEIKKFSNHYTS